MNNPVLHTTTEEVPPILLVNERPRREPTKQSIAVAVGHSSLRMSNFFFADSLKRVRKEIGRREAKPFAENLFVLASLRKAIRPHLLTPLRAINITRAFVRGLPLSSVECRTYLVESLPEDSPFKGNVMHRAALQVEAIKLAQRFLTDYLLELSNYTEDSDTSPKETLDKFSDWVLNTRGELYTPVAKVKRERPANKPKEDTATN